VNQWNAVTSDKLPESGFASITQIYGGAVSQLMEDNPVYLPLAGHSE